MKRFLIGFLLLSGVLAARAQDPTTRLAYEYYNSREFEKAAPLFLKLYEENRVPSYLRYHVVCLIELKDFDMAVRTVRWAIRQTRDIALNVELGYVYEESGDHAKAEEAYNEPFKRFPDNAPSITNLGSTYASFGKYNYAQMVYEMGRKVLGNPNEFRIELAGIFYSQRKFPEMLDEYYNLLLADPKYVPTVQAMIQSALNNDIDETLLQQTRDITYRFIQQWPGLPTFYEMLVWVLTQEKKFEEAVDEAIAMDRRNQAPPVKLVQVARTAADAGSADAAIRAYEYLISRGNTGPERAEAWQLARVEYLQTLYSKLSFQNPSLQEWETLANRYRTTLTDLNRAVAADPLYLELAQILSFRLGNHEGALEVIEGALALQGKPPIFRTRCLLKKADVYLSSGDPWEASLVYSMVDLENADNPEGAEARYRKAQLSWFTGNFTWALAQLDILKGSTSKPNANDAMELSILIRENISDTDSTQQILRKLAEADYLRFRNRTDDALHIYDSLLTADPEGTAADDCLFQKAEILVAKDQTPAAMELLEKIIDRYRYEYWGHKALYRLACIYQDKVNDIPKATALLEDFIRDFPSSFYFLDARNRLKALKLKPGK